MRAPHSPTYSIENQSLDGRVHLEYPYEAESKNQLALHRAHDRLFELILF